MWNWTWNIFMDAICRESKRVTPRAPRHTEKQSPSSESLGHTAVGWQLSNKRPLRVGVESSQTPHADSHPVMGKPRGLHRRRGQGGDKVCSHGTPARGPAHELLTLACSLPPRVDRAWYITISTSPWTVVPRGMTALPSSILKSLENRMRAERLSQRASLELTNAEIHVF